MVGSPWPRASSLRSACPAIAWPTSAARNSARKTIDMLLSRRNRRMLSWRSGRSPSRTGFRRRSGRGRRRTSLASVLQLAVVGLGRRGWLAAGRGHAPAVRTLVEEVAPAFRERGERARHVHARVRHGPALRKVERHDRLLAG